MHLLALALEALGFLVLVAFRAFANMLGAIVVQPYLKSAQWMEEQVDRLADVWNRIR